MIANHPGGKGADGARPRPLLREMTHLYFGLAASRCLIEELLVGTDRRGRWRWRRSGRRGRWWCDDRWWGRLRSAGRKRNQRHSRNAKPGDRTRHVNLRRIWWN
jgi:hypothetical protein